MSDWCISFTSGVLSTLIGVGFGLPFALLIDRLITRRKNKEDKNTVLLVLMNTIKKNIGLLEQMSNEFKRNAMPFYPIDIIVLESYAKDYHSLLRIEICSKLDTIRYELLHIGRKLDKMFELYDQVFNESKITRSYEIFKASIASHAEILIPQLSEMLELLDKEVNEKMFRASPSGRSARKNKSVDGPSKSA